VNTILVLAAHPDDETLGCGGALLRHIERGDRVAWCIATVASEPRWSTAVIKAKNAEIDAVAEAFGFASVHRLAHPAPGLASVPRETLVQELRGILQSLEPDTVYCVSARDAHDDHQALFAGAAAALKPFRSTVRRFLVYETLSSTDVAASDAPFSPNVFVDIGSVIERKLEILTMYASEVAPPPFPRSAETLRALARVRGAASGVEYAEAFQLIRERW